jgi:hypothetical protein
LSALALSHDAQVLSAIEKTTEVDQNEAADTATDDFQTEATVDAVAALTDAEADVEDAS